MIENQLERIAVVLEELCRLMNTNEINEKIPLPLAQSQPAPVAATPFPMTPAAPPPAPAAPAAPTLPAAPFTDINGLKEYVMATYKALGAQKGMSIQNVLGGLGYSNVNDIKPEHFAQFYAGVEALKG